MPSPKSAALEEDTWQAGTSTFADIVAIFFSSSSSSSSSSNDPNLASAKQTIASPAPLEFRHTQIAVGLILSIAFVSLLFTVVALAVGLHQPNVSVSRKPSRRHQPLPSPPNAPPYNDGAPAKLLTDPIYASSAPSVTSSPSSSHHPSTVRNDYQDSVVPSMSQMASPPPVSYHRQTQEQYLHQQQEQHRYVSHPANFPNNGYPLSPVSLHSDTQHHAAESTISVASPPADRSPFNEISGVWLRSGNTPQDGPTLMTVPEQGKPMHLQPVPPKRVSVVPNDQPPVAPKRYSVVPPQSGVLFGTLESEH
ncbi:hypothetical protein DFJ73DRAFT_473328 [Zopfochytrium polystomum]|nr:hypothetical protein DFJ73DRAFT_473328 [Zopfochytrium polystomum]